MRKSGKLLLGVLSVAALIGTGMGAFVINGTYGSDTDTIGACTGGLAGIIYGEDSINSNWKNSLLKIEYIQDLCDKFDDKLEEIINNPEECNNNPK